MRIPTIAALLFLASGCLPRASVPDTERVRVEREIEGSHRWLEVAVHVGPFFGDAGKLLASDQPFAELELLEGPAGEVISPPPSQRILPPGTAVRIRSVEFPTGWIIAKRVVTTPRYHPWVHLEVLGEPRPVILVLPQKLTTFDEVQLELDRWLSPIDPAPELRAFPEEHRNAISRKRLVDGMAPRAVEMAWGYPERKRLDRPAATEEWVWPGNRRRAWFKDARLARWEGR